MPIFDQPLYALTDASNVMIGGKEPGLVERDLADGIARIGGFWRQPNYFEAYLHAAELLIDKGKETGSLDAIGLPGFYLQRHTIELMIKGVLGWLTYIADLRFELGRSTYRPSKRMLEAINRSHNLKVLLDHSITASSQQDLPSPPDGLVSLIHDMIKIESTETWSRYSSSSKKNGEETPVSISHVQHIPCEIVIPICEFQRRLSEVARQVSSRKLGGESYEDDLHEVWSELNATVEGWNDVRIVR